MINLLLLATAVTTAIPNGFLLYEQAAAKKDRDPQTTWAVSRGKGAKLVVNPCDKAALGQAGRAAAKTITYTAVPDFSKSEQVVLYATDAAAGQAIQALKTAARKCSTKDYRFSWRAVSLGDEAITVTGQNTHGVGGERAVVARRADALVIYTQAGEWGKPSAADFKRQSADAARMLTKICGLAAC
ncbi:hypothetical protein [Nonomuraea sediminis]|uniref:hypothetical protein n=1 Tax=Nonomuraea sediminis TaxID=2835864 RepID=UPI001BDC209F|nr:hypothetical protein [Nonomuraea sediminis]